MSISEVLPETESRASESTSAEVNRKIRLAMERRVRTLARSGPNAINRRLEELDHEWDIERTLEANASSAVLAGLVLGVTVDKRFFVLPGIVGAFLLQHALQGWCPPLPLFRAMGIRTAKEINEERFALKSLRGDFRVVNSGPTAASNLENVFTAVRA